VQLGDNFIVAEQEDLTRLTFFVQLPVHQMKLGPYSQFQVPYMLHKKVNKTNYFSNCNGHSPISSIHISSKTTFILSMVLPIGSTCASIAILPHTFRQHLEHAMVIAHVPTDS